MIGSLWVTMDDGDGSPFLPVTTILAVSKNINTKPLTNAHEKQAHLLDTY